MALLDSSQGDRPLVAKALSVAIGLDLTTLGLTEALYLNFDWSELDESLSLTSGDSMLSESWPPDDRTVCLTVVATSLEHTS